MGVLKWRLSSHAAVDAGLQRQTKQNDIVQISKSELVPVQDADSPNIYVDKLIGNDQLLCKVMQVNNRAMTVCCLEVSEPYSWYLNPLEQYPLWRYDDLFVIADYPIPVNDKIIYKVAPGHLELEDADLWLRWERGRGWRWELK